MANIEINELKPVGAELFSDSEDFMNELSDNELYNINGGVITITTVTLDCDDSTTNHPSFTHTFARTCGQVFQADKGSKKLQADNGSRQLQWEALP